MATTSRRPPSCPRGSGGGGGRWKALWAAGCFLAAASQAEGANPPPDHFQFGGACDSLSYVNSLIFDKQGVTANSSPYYKARGQELYIYYDANCAGSGDGTKRWILDSDRPSMTHYTDLDGDFGCNYLARVNSDDGLSPPFLADWKMECAGGWAERYVALLVITTTSTTTTVTTTTVTTTTVTTTTETTTTVTTTTGTETSTTQTATSTTETATTTRRWFSVSGACEAKDFLNGLVFEEGGKTANGAPWFVSVSPQMHIPQYVYYDLDCNGGSDGVPRWIIDTSEPIESLAEDVDNDTACNYHTRIDSSDPSFPPESGEWYMHCGAGWKRQLLNVSSDPSILEDLLPKPEAESKPDESHPVPHDCPGCPGPEAGETDEDPVTEPEHPTEASAPATTQVPHGEDGEHGQGHGDGKDVAGSGKSADPTDMGAGDLSSAAMRPHSGWPMAAAVAAAVAAIAAAC